MPEVLFNRKIFFDTVRKSLFGGSMSSQQVDGMDFKLQQWEAHPYHPTDLRWLSYPFATSFHETGAKMWPIEEYGKGSGKEYGKPHPKTGKTYYGRGDVQLTWYENYVRAARELGYQNTTSDLALYPEKALDPKISADVMFMGMREGWFRKSTVNGKTTPNTLFKYFSAGKDDPYMAREIINGDKHIVPKWSNGVSIGNLIKGYHGKFLTALEAALIEVPEVPELPEIIVEPGDVVFDVTAKNAKVTIKFNGAVVFTHTPPAPAISTFMVAEPVEEEINPDVPEPEIGIGEVPEETAETTA